MQGKMYTSSSINARTDITEKAKKQARERETCKNKIGPENHERAQSITPANAGGKPNYNPHLFKFATQFSKQKQVSWWWCRNKNVWVTRIRTTG